MRPLIVVGIAIALGTAACGAAPAHGTAGPATVPVKPPVTNATIVATDDDPGGLASEVFERAKLEMAAGKLAHARTLFDRVAVADKAERGEAPPSTLGLAAAYNAALCSEGLSEPKDARDRYRALAKASPESTDAIDAQLRRGRLDVEIDDIADLVGPTSALLARTDLLRTDRAEVLGLQALLLVSQGELAAADKNVTTALGILEGDAPPPQNAAAVHYASGELLRARANAIKFVPIPADFSSKLELRCQRMLDAEDAYIEAIKTKQVRWAVRAGYRVATLYSSLHDDLVAIPPPASADTEARKALFRGAMRLRYRILLEKGLGTLDHTINLQATATTAGTSKWFDKAKEAKTSLEKQLADEKAEIAKLPYTEEQLKQALEDLAKKESPAKEPKGSK